MKKLVLGILLMPTLAFSQVSSWRTNSPQQSGGSTQSAPRVQQSIPQQQNNVSSWRNNPPETSRPNYNIIAQPNNWGWGGNNWGWQWNNWGWYQPYPYIWYNDFGSRQRSVINIYENGRRDTIAKKPIYFTAGLGYTNNNQTSFWGAIGGNKSYFIMDYSMTTAIDQNQYYPYGQINNVDFPLSKEDWKKESTFYVGGGKRIGKIGIHGMIGFGNEIIRWQGKDKIGGISFPKSNSSFTTFKVGVIRDFKFLTLKAEVDPIRSYYQIGIGLNNK